MMVRSEYTAVAEQSPAVCPLRELAKSMPAKRVKKSLFQVYRVLLINIFSNACWRG